MLKNNKLNIKVIDNFTNVRLTLLFFPFLLLFVIVLILFKKNSFSVNGYIRIQEDLFFYLNNKLSLLSSLQFNLTQLGDAFIFLSLLTLFIIYAPKLWEALLSTLIISGLITFPLKKLFAVPRPAAMFDNDSFVIIGRTLTGHTSLPSGHSITAFSIITVLFFAFRMNKFKLKVLWFISFLALGFIVVFSRVAVGAHYPIDVVIGAAIGYFCAVTGVVLNNKFNFWTWVKKVTYYPIFIVVLIISTFIIIKKIYDNNLFIFYISLLSIVLTLYLMIKIYVKEKY